MSDRNRYDGGCQCGAVRFEATIDLPRPTVRNCSRCPRLGWIMAFTPTDSFTLLRGADSLTEYRFNREVIAHQFCRVCGIEPFARGTPPGAAAEMVAVNVRCIDGVDPASLQPTMFDGKSR